MSKLNRYREYDQDSDHSEIEIEPPTSDEYQQGLTSESPQFEIPVQPSILSEITEPPMNPTNITFSDQVPGVTEVPETNAIQVVGLQMVYQS